MLLMAYSGFPNYIRSVLSMCVLRRIQDFLATLGASLACALLRIQDILTISGASLACVLHGIQDILTTSGAS
jgi:branched-subunit amino acid transport protein AzlD